jgi:hypothetical protein
MTRALGSRKHAAGQTCLATSSAECIRIIRNPNKTDSKFEFDTKR